MSNETPVSLSWQLLNRLFSAPLDPAFVGEILGLPVDHMVAPEVLSELLEALEKWAGDPGIQAASQLSFQRLFLGPEAPLAPPWGSVYLTPDNTLMGPSTLAVRRAFLAYGLALENQGGEPEDHFAHCCAFLSLVTEKEGQEGAKGFLTDHLLPWGPRFLELVIEHAKDPVYGALARYGQAVLGAVGSDNTPGDGEDPPAPRLYL
ncbi:MAG: molecular chaperone TorD family protein [Desulfovibrionales bacterium]|nr:molecular chaperone TorD family protein [Desulfovibrionales bacterium]